ncbi:hypothetical protein ANO14919_021290 [Xylariales sp. No.14919]|nr:hypothetical protein ANO14919_021290 [Xylariales sp. No.14919]
MPTIRTLLFTFFVYASFTVALTNAAYFGVRSSQGDSTGSEHVDDTVSQKGESPAFSRLLSAVSPRALHQLLHEYAPNTFKHGIFNSDRYAAEAVHARSPALASTIVHLAVRQGTSGNDTTTSDAPAPTDSSSSSSTPATTSDIPSTASTTSTDETTTTAEQTPTETTETPQNTPTSSSTPVTTSTPTSSSTPTEATETTETTETAETTETTETPGLTSSSSWQTSESSRDVDSSTASTFSTSTTPTPTSRTSTFTSTLPGGVVTTVTEVAVVTPGATGGDSTTSAIGNLQTGSSAPIVRGPGFEILAGFLVGGIMLS